MNRRPGLRGQGGSQLPQEKLEYPLPKEAVRAWVAHQGQEAQNPGLLFDRFAPDLRKEPSRAAEPWKKQGLRQVLEAAKKVDAKLLDAYRARWQAVAAAVFAVPFILQTDWRLAAGLGSKGSYEVGFTFHRYGFPYLPGSSLKGVARAAALWEVAESVTSGANANPGAVGLRHLEEILETEKAEEFKEKFNKAFSSVEEDGIELALKFRAVFGTTASAGGAVFLDAVPAKVPRLDLDIMNPHYPKYYQSAEPPANWQSPVPVYFLTVAPGTEFLFGVGWRGSKQGEWGALRSRAEDWLRVGLSQLGVGAKTSAGYGYFRVESAPDGLASSSEAGAIAPPVPEARVQLEQDSPPAEERAGTIVEIRPDQRRGRVRDDETGREYAFRTDVIQGAFPGRRNPVLFVREGERVIRLRRRA